MLTKQSKGISYLVYDTIVNGHIPQLRIAFSCFSQLSKSDSWRQFGERLPEMHCSCSASKQEIHFF